MLLDSIWSYRRPPAAAFLNQRKFVDALRFPEIIADLGRMQAKQSALAKQVMSQNRKAIQSSNAVQSPSPPQDAVDMLPPPAGAVRSAAAPGNTSSMATALRSLNDLGSQVPLRDRANAPDGTPPYARSLSSTAPSSPRM